MINKYINDEINIEELILFFDKNNYTEEEIKKRGVVYTPKYICEIFIKNLKPEPTETIYEPSVGHGIFIISLLEYMEDKVDDLKDYFLNYVFGQDIQKKNIEEFKEIVIAFFSKKGIKISQKEMINFKQGDSLLNKKKYDIIFGNPPYIKIQNLSDNYANFLKENFKSCEKGNIDIYFAFIKFAYNHSNRCSYIVPNSWIFSKSGKTLREIIKDRLTFIVDYKEEKIFKGVGTYTSIFVIEKNKNNKITLENYGKQYVLNKDEIDEFKIKNTLKANKNLIERYHTPIATLRDKIFLKDTPDSITFYKISKVKDESSFLKEKEKIIFPYNDDFSIKKELDKKQ